MSPSDTKVSNPIIFYDSNCALCGGFVSWILKRDTRRLYCFASLTGATAQAANLPPESQIGAGSVVLYKDNSFSYRSAAVLSIFSGLGGVFKLALVCKLLPRVFRDWLYDGIAERRGAIGRSFNCKLVEGHPNPRFLP